MQDELKRFYPPHIGFSELDVEEVIGVGGFGKVYRGYYQSQEVAVKAARRDADEDLGTIKERVLQEGRLFWLLKHDVSNSRAHRWGRGESAPCSPPPLEKLPNKFFSNFGWKVA